MKSAIGLRNDKAAYEYKLLTGIRFRNFYI